MKVIFCEPSLTIGDYDKANAFYEECKSIFDTYVEDKRYISSDFHLGQLLVGISKKDDIFIFFTSLDGNYKTRMISVLEKYNATESRIWAIAMENTSECRRPPYPVSTKQSFDVFCRNENRNPLRNNMKAIAQIFSRKVISQTLSPLYRDEVLYFISHRRTDGEFIASKLADELTKLTRERNVYRDVVNVAVGDDAQIDINNNLKQCDVLIFIQTEQAQFSEYIMKELCYAITNDIPVLWIRIDNAAFDKMDIRPSEGPLLDYKREEFKDKFRIEEIADEIEENCFKLIMQNSSQVYTYIECLNDLSNRKKISLNVDKSSIYAYEIEYAKKTKDIYDEGTRKHYVQCFGRVPKENDIHQFIGKVRSQNFYAHNDTLFLLTNHAKRSNLNNDKKILIENYEDYITNLKFVSGDHVKRKGKKIIISGAFPDYDEIYKLSLVEALLVYSKEIIRRGYTLVFGAHPTFQNLIFDIGKIYSTSVKESIEMHMDKAFIQSYDIDELNSKCTLILSDGIQKMRERMIQGNDSELLICLGGRIKEDKSDQGVDIEVGLAQKNGIPIALVWNCWRKIK